LEGVPDGIGKAPVVIVRKIEKRAPDYYGIYQGSAMGAGTAGMTKVW
jgi:hypothetical protein